MKNIKRRILTLAICLSMCLVLVLPANAAGEVTFSAVLSESNFTVSENNQTVTMMVVANQAVSIDQFSGYISYDSPLTIASIESGDASLGALNTQGTSTSSGAFMWYTGDANVDNVTNILKVTFNIPANTEAATYNVGFNQLKVTKDYTMTDVVNGGSATATITVTESAPDDGGDVPTGEYTATIAGAATNSNPVRVGQTLKVNIGTNQTYAATEMTISYPSDLVSFVADESTLGNAAVTDNGSGTLTLADYGANKEGKGNNYVLAFEAIEKGDAEFKIEKAGFGTGTSAEDKKLDAADEKGSVTVNIVPANLNVTLDTAYYYAEKEQVPYGEDFVFYPENTTGEFYDYETPTATVGGQDATVQEYTDTNGKKGWIIKNVTGDVIITHVGRDGKPMGNITYKFEGDATAEDLITEAVEAKYGVDISFKIPVDLAKDNANGTDGYFFGLKVKIGSDSDYDGYTTSTSGEYITYVIPGEDVIGAVEITLTKTADLADKVIVEIQGATGDGDLVSGDQSGNKVSVNKDGSVELTVDVTGAGNWINKGYAFEVLVNGEPVKLEDDGSFTIENIDANTVVTINKVVDVSDATNVNKDGESLVTLKDEQTMWLIRLPSSFAADETTKALYTYTYNGEEYEMFWSTKHEAYVTVVISAERPEIKSEDFTLEAVAEIDTLATDWDVNKSGNVDANDAQLIWNMYNTLYTGFTTTVTPEKFMLADANYDGVLDVTDATVIIEKILAAAGAV